MAVLWDLGTGIVILVMTLSEAARMLVFTDCKGAIFQGYCSAGKGGQKQISWKSCKLSVPTEIQPFFLDVCFLECCKPFVDFQSSEEVISDNVPCPQCFCRGEGFQSPQFSVSLAALPDALHRG